MNINEKVMKYLERKKYEIAKASEPSNYLVFVPYEEHMKVALYLKKHDVKRNIRFNHDYSIAVFTI